jgi:DNA-binding Lrp family transcriptional regulator
MKAYILIKIRTGDVKEVIRQLGKITAVKSAEMTFGPYDAIAVVEQDDVGHLGTLLATVIQPIPGIEQTLTCLAVDL